MPLESGNWKCKYKQFAIKITIDAFGLFFCTFGRALANNMNQIVYTVEPLKTDNSRVKPKCPSYRVVPLMFVCLIEVFL